MEEHVEGNPPPAPLPEDRQREDTAALRRSGRSAPADELTRLAGDYSHPPRRRRRLLPLLLFLATCLSTFWTGAVDWMPILRLDQLQRAWEVFAEGWQQQSPGAGWAHAVAVLRLEWLQGFQYMAAVLGILLTHEMGHFLMALRHRIPASLPFFIPVPMLPFGTMGAVIGMQGSKADRREMFDLGVAGPLAGLAVALPVTWIGIEHLDAAIPPGSGFCFHNPLVFRLLIDYLRPDYPTSEVLYLNQFNPFLMAGWVGMLVTGLNMVPVSQLDGGHVAYALLGKRAHALARGLLVAAILFILAAEQYNWVLMLVLVILIGTDHPPTANDHVPLGWHRRVIGWAALSIPIFCFPSMGVTDALP